MLGQLAQHVAQHAASQGHADAREPVEHAPGALVQAQDATKRDVIAASGGPAAAPAPGCAAPAPAPAAAELPLPQADEEPLVGHGGDTQRAAARVRAPPQSRQCCVDQMNGAWMLAVLIYGLQCFVQRARHGWKRGHLIPINFAYLFKNLFFEMDSRPGQQLEVRIESAAGVGTKHARLGLGYESNERAEAIIVKHPVDGKWRFTMFLERGRGTPRVDNHMLHLAGRSVAFGEVLWELAFHFHIPCKAAQTPVLFSERQLASLY
mmetsp:Transcript_1195/g.4284  ORF Transcript_1195/g.4284 Transcript_1195/m.4284 type:complete len:264 (-) Transcript_1195:109-900(-)